MQVLIEIIGNRPDVNQLSALSAQLRDVCYSEAASNSNAVFELTTECKIIDRIEELSRNLLVDLFPSVAKCQVVVNFGFFIFFMFLFG